MYYHPGLRGPNIAGEMPRQTHSERYLSMEGGRYMCARNNNSNHLLSSRQRALFIVVSSALLHSYGAVVNTALSIHNR